MDPTELKDIALKSCDDMYEQIDAMQRGSDPDSNSMVAMVVNDVRNVKRMADYVIITLGSKINDTDNLGLHIEGEGDFFENDIEFDDYDQESMTVVGYPSDRLMQLINDHPNSDIKVIIDMKWLISLTKECFTQHGDNIGKIREPIGFSDDEIEFPRGEEPTAEQRRAVKTILNSKLSYVWGAPGTGKTQYVLSTAILAYLKKGKRVAIIAPTNNSVEQVLRGVMNVIKRYDPEQKLIVPSRDVLRMGTATSGFIKEFKEICEDSSIRAQINHLQSTNKTIEEILYERSLEALKPKIDRLRTMVLADGPYNKAPLDDRTMSLWDEVSKVISEKDEFAGMVEGVDKYNLRTRFDSIIDAIMNRTRRALAIGEYKDTSDDELRRIIRNNLEKIAELEPRDSIRKAKTAKVIAMTPFILMGRPTLFESGGVVDVDHIFIDEVGYSNLIQTMPVFMCGPPVSMLGDHMQLPPVCEIDRDDIIAWCQEKDELCEKGFMKHSFLWDMSALYTESLLFGEIDELKEDYIKQNDPRFKKTKQINLTYSMRFADNLARILDKCVYKNGIRGHNKNQLKIMYIDSGNLAPVGRRNEAEAVLIKKYIERAQYLHDFAVLTPYTKQKCLIKTKCKLQSDRLLTIHGSQGREWDTVIISVVDNKNSPGSYPLRLTSCLYPNSGLKVMNTAVSRARKKLIIVCDYEFWRNRADKDDLLGMILADPETVKWDENQLNSREMNDLYGSQNTPKNRRHSVDG